VVAIELMAGAQAVEFRKPLKLGRGTAVAYEVIRQHVPRLEEDRPVQYDINSLAEVIRSGELLDAVEREVGPLVSYPEAPFGHKP
jgi:histidine ammonia-lyase